jgi:hypothetical protein
MQIVLPIGIRNLTSMKPPTHLDNLFQYTAFAANTVGEIAGSFGIPFLGSTATLVLAILKYVEVCVQYCGELQEVLD